MRRRKQPVLVAVALCLGGALTACGGGDGGGFTAVGAGPSPGGAVGPSGAVELVPLETPTASGTISSTSSPSPGAPESPRPPGASPSTVTGTGADSGSGTRPDAGSDADPGSPGSGAGPGDGPGGRREPGTPPGEPSGGSATTAPPRTTVPAPRPTASAPRPTASAPRPSSPAPTPGPAALTVSAPVTADGETRWCEQVTVTFRNTGGSPVTSGTATFATHVIGALGLDWGTVTTSQPLPAPIAAGAARKQTYTVCVESWRVPLGMRVDTREVTADWR
ncbi:hypothetical protein [Streptomyces filamentosus]|uniref:hypothetical protein n=1 Tax=Streptomyces filamentosus TaxID=67294 RepID=UPI0033D64D79